MTRPNRVLLLSEEISLSDGEAPPNGGGAHMAATLAGLRDHFDVATLFGAGAEGDSLPGLSRLRRLVPGRMRGLRQDLLRCVADRSFSRHALAAGREFGPDVVYWRNEYLSRSGLVVAHSLGVPLVMEVNGLLANDVRSMYRSLAEPYGAALERRKLRSADVVVTVSPGLADALVELGAVRDRVVVVPNSVSVERLASPRIAADKPSVTIGWVGHLMQWHREALGMLIEIAPDVLRRAPRAEFVVIGGGPGLEQLKERVAGAGLAGRFRFTGTVPSDEVPGLLADVDIGVIPAVFDYAFPVKLVEFGAAGLAVVAPRSESLDRQLAAGSEYAPFPSGDRAALADVLAGLVLDGERRRALGGALQRAVRERFTWPVTGRSLERAVRLAIEPPGGRD